MVSNLIFSQSTYPFQTIIKGDTVVILTKEQANSINGIVESQKAEISAYKIELNYKDSLLSVRNDFDLELRKRLDLLENWATNIAIDGTWLYYSILEHKIYQVDLSQYTMKKDDISGDIFFIRNKSFINHLEQPYEPQKDWQLNILENNRPKISISPYNFYYEKTF